MVVLVWMLRGCPCWCIRRMGGTVITSRPCCTPFRPMSRSAKCCTRAGLAVDDQHFKAGLVVEMRVAGGDNQVVVFVLRFGQLFVMPWHDGRR